MSRIRGKLEHLKEKGEKALMVYVTAGDPSLERTRELILGLEASGVDLVEVGVPFSDPTADGPVIQAACGRGLRSGTTLADILKMMGSLRGVSSIPLVLFSYYNPIFAMGCSAFAERASAAGADGVLVVDLPAEEAGELREHTDPLGLDFIPLVAPTTQTRRVRKIAEGAGGFLYCISVTGVTGTSRPDLSRLKRDVGRIRRVSSLPLAVGFGISTPEQVREIVPSVDGVVVGSALVRLIAEQADGPRMVDRVCGFARRLKEATLPLS